MADKYKFKHADIVLEAFQYNGKLTNTEGKHYIPDWAIKEYEKGYLAYDSDGLYIQYGKLKFRVEIGDYIFKSGGAGTVFRLSEEETNKRWTKI